MEFIDSRKEDTMNIALIFAGGTGTRMNSKGKPKQFLELNGKPIIIHTIERFEEHPLIDVIIVVCHKEWINYLVDQLKKHNIRKVNWVVSGGKNSQDSIRNGLFKLENSIEDTNNAIVLIHDGVRPLVDSETITQNIYCVEKYGSAITAVPATETVISIDKGDNVNEVYERNRCYLARAPQSFYLKDILEAHKKQQEEAEKIDIIDSATLMTRQGIKLHIVEGSYENIKITTPSDFYIFRAIIDAKENSQIWGM